MRILLLNPIANVGGAERILLTAVAGVRRERPDAVVRVLTFGDGPLAPAVRALGAEFESISLGAGVGQLGDSHTRGRGWRGKAGLIAAVLPTGSAVTDAVRRLGTAVRRFAPHVVHSNGIKTHILGRLAIPPSVPVVWHVHDFFSLRPTAAGLLRRCRGRVAAAVAISRAVAEDATRVLAGVPVVTVPNAVDLTRFSPGPADGARLDAAAGLPPAPAGTLRIGLVATYARWKGHLVLLDAAARLVATAPKLPIRWFLIGGPIYQTAEQFSEAELRSAAAERGLTGRVGFIGYTPDTERVYRSLDVVVHASTLPEPFGLTIAEAMACGRPVVVSSAGGAAELFRHGVDALGFDPGHANQLAENVRRLAEEADLRIAMGRAARHTAERAFDATRFGKQLVELWESVASRRSVPARLTTSTRLETESPGHRTA